MPHKKLFIPGPSEVLDDVLQKLATPQIGHRSKDFQELFARIVPKVQQVLYTKNKIVLGTCSGTGLMEMAIRCFSKKRILATQCGAFSERWTSMVRENGKECDAITVEWGKHVSTEEIDRALATGKYDCMLYTHNETSTGVMNPVEEIAEVMKKYPDVVWCVDAVSSMMGYPLKVDELAVDFIFASTQKCWGLPAGMAIAAVSEKALARAAEVPNRGHYLDVLAYMKSFEKNETPTTPAIPHLFALDYQLDKILAEGLDNRWKRHQEMAKYMRDWATKYFELYPEKGYESVTLTTIKNTRNIAVGDLNKELAKRFKQIANGYGKLKDQTFRIAHMGDLTMHDMKELTADIEEILKLA